MEIQLLAVGGVETMSGMAEVTYRPVIVSIDVENGLVNWAKEYVVEGHSSFLDSVVSIDDEFFAVGQLKWSNGQGFDVFLMRIDSTGDLVWSKTVSPEPGIDNGFYLDVGSGVQCVQLADGSSVVMVNSIRNIGLPQFLMSAHLMWLDAQGNLEWLNDLGLQLGVTAFSSISSGGHQSEIVLAGGYSPNSFDFIGGL